MQVLSMCCCVIILYNLQPDEDEDDGIDRVNRIVCMFMLHSVHVCVLIQFIV